MGEDLKQIEQLLALFDKRQKLRNQCNREIAEVLTPTVLAAIFELVDVSTEDIVWEDMDVIQSVLVIRAEITYNPAKEISHFLTLVMPAPSDGESPIKVQRVITLGIPLTVVFQEKETIKGWLMNVALGNQAEVPSTPEQPKQPQQFDMSGLTKEQLMQVLLSKHLITGTPQ